MGRQAYLNWAVGKLVPAASGSGGDEVLDTVERDMRAAGGVEGVEKLHGAAG
jgi:kinetochore protein Mis12/MTW1